MRQTIKNMTPMLITCLIAGVVLAILSPFESHKLSVMFRFTYWVGLCIAGGLGAASTDLVAYLLKKKLPIWPRALFQSITAAIAVFAIITWLTYYLGGRIRGPQDAVVTFLYVWVISITIASVGALIAKRSKNDVNVPSRAALYERLPAHLRSAEIYALAAEDHYVRVITTRGDELILMRLSDAVSETAPLKGLRPHRSWWVAEAGVEKIKKSEIILRSGQNVPISRTGMKQVREAGWK